MISIPLVHHNHFAAFRPHTGIFERSAIFGRKITSFWGCGYCNNHVIFRDSIENYFELNQVWTHDRKVLSPPVPLILKKLVWAFWTQLLKKIASIVKCHQSLLLLLPPLSQYITRPSTCKALINLHELYTLGINLGLFIYPRLMALFSWLRRYIICMRALI